MEVQVCNRWGEMDMVQSEGGAGGVRVVPEITVFARASETCLSASPGGLIKLPSAGPVPRVTNLVSVGWGLRICMFNELPDAVAGR